MLYAVRDTADRRDRDRRVGAEADRIAAEACLREESAKRSAKAQGDRIAALVAGGIGEASAKAVVALIASGAVRHISIADGGPPQEVRRTPPLKAVEAAVPRDRDVTDEEASTTRADVRSCLRASIFFADDACALRSMYREVKPS